MPCSSEMISQNWKKEELLLNQQHFCSGVMMSGKRKHPVQSSVGHHCPITIRVRPQKKKKIESQDINSEKTESPLKLLVVIKGLHLKLASSNQDRQGEQFSFQKISNIFESSFVHHFHDH